jgi:hypothetical protein
MGQLAEGLRMFTELLAERTGRPADDFAVHNLAGAVIGTLLVAMLRAAENPSMDIFDAVEPAFAHLEAGLPL